MSRAWRSVVPLVAGFLLVTAGRPAYAAAPDQAAGPEQEAAAAELFNRALDRMMAGDYDAACPAFAESFRLDPRAGSLFTLAECEAKQGRPATASVHYAEYLQRFAALTPREQERQRERKDIAERQVAALRSQIAYLTVALPPHAPSELTVTRDGSPLGPVQLDVELPVDPGDHVLSAHLPRAAARDRRIRLAPGEHARWVVELPAVPPPAVVVTPVDPPRSRSSVWTWSAVGVGVAGVAVGAVFGAVTLSKKSVIDAHCAAHVCDDEGKRAADSASTTGTISTVGFITGGVGLAAGLLLALTAPRSRVAAFLPEVRVERQSATLSVEQRF